MALPHQVPILLSPARFKLVVCGRRWGKTVAGLMATIRGHGPTRGTFRGAVDGGRIWWIAPSYPTANEVIWPQLKRALEPVAVRVSQQEHSILLPNGGSVSVKSADNPDSLRGQGLDGAVLDEAAFCDRRIWFDVIQPMLADYQGWAMFLTSPNGCNWLHKLYIDAADRSGWARWQRPTRENSRIKAEELDRAKRDTGPRAYAQEYEAMFTEEDGALFPAHYFLDEIWFDEWPEPTDIDFRCIACDPSLGKTELADYSALVCVAKQKLTGTYFVKADIARRPPAQIVADSLDLYESFGAQAIGFEAVGFQELLLESFQEKAAEKRLDVFPVEIRNATRKVKRVLQLDGPLSRGEIKFLRGDRGTELLIEQLRGFPLPKYHDDGPDALEMGIRLCEQAMCGAIIEPGREEWIDP